MKKILIAVQILIVILIGAYIVYVIARPKPELTHNPEPWHSWQGFFALSYPGITTKGEGGYVSRDKLAEQLQALQRAGYTSITPEDAAAFLEDRAPLPDKAVLLLFEGGRKDSFIYATPLLQKSGMRATMCVPTSLTSTWGTFYLKESDYEKLLKEAYWSLCSMGDRALNEIPLDNAGSKGHFLTRRMWSGNGLEDSAAFKKRVTEDYARAANFLERLTGKKIQAYLYPFADPGTGANADPLSFELNRKAVSAYHRMAFASAEDPFNGPYAKPFSLSRVRVRSDWDGNHLLRELQNFMPRVLPAEGLTDETWFTKGSTRLTGKALTLSSGSGMWLRGSNHWSDVDITLKVRLTAQASLAFFVRYEGADSFLRLTLTRNSILLHEHTGAASQTLARTPIASSDGEHALRIRVKRNRAWIWHNDRSIAHSIPLSSSLVRGRIGMSGQNGEIELMDVRVVPLASVFAFADGYRRLASADQQKISAVLPRWFTQDTVPKVTVQQRMDLLIAASSGVQTIPVIESRKDMTADGAGNFTKAIGSALDSQSIRPLVTHMATYGEGTELPEALHKDGYHVIRILSPEEASHFVKEKQSVNRDLILIKGHGEKMEETMNRLLHFIPVDRLIVQTDSASTLPAGMSTAVDFTAGTERGAK